MKKLNYLIICLVILLSSCQDEGNRESSLSGDSVHSSKEKMSASLRFNWIPSCSFAGDILGAKVYSDTERLILKIEAGGPGIDPLKLVAAGENTFGVAGADLVIAANDKGADFVIIGLVSYDSPGVWLAKKEKNITTIEDVKGKRIGELPGGNMQYLYEIFLNKTDLVRNKDFEPVPIPFELKNFIVQDECDLRPVFIYDEPSALDIAGVEYTILEPKDYNIDFKGLSYFCNRKTIQKNPELVQAFINTMARGWEAALKNPNEAIKYLQKFDESINAEKELLGLKTGLDYFKGYNGKVLSSDTASWEVMIEDMAKLGLISKRIQPTDILNLSFINKYHHSK